MIQRVTTLYRSLDTAYPREAKVARFLIAGGTSTGVDLILLYVFTDFFAIWYLTAAALAFSIAFFVSFGLQKFWTFRDHSRQDVSMQAGLYFVIAIINLMLNTTLVYGFVEYAHLHYLLAQIVASILIACESYFVYQRFVFRVTAV